MEAHVHNKKKRESSIRQKYIVAGEPQKTTKTHVFITQHPQPIECPTQDRDADYNVNNREISYTELG